MGVEQSKVESQEGESNKKRETKKKKTEKYESSWSRVESEHDDMTQKRFGQIFKKNRESPFETQSR